MQFTVEIPSELDEELVALLSSSYPQYAFEASPSDTLRKVTLEFWKEKLSLSAIDQAAQAALQSSQSLLSVIDPLIAPAPNPNEGNE